MNAPQAAATLAASTLDMIPITSIRPSSTEIQKLRRAHFDTAKLIELAESVKTQGVLQPILVRPVKPDGTVKFEIVAGERRWIAADRAGLAHVPCVVRELADDQVLEAQLVENLQREDISALEEAEAYRELTRLKHYSADQLAARVGKSKAYVYARLKLIDLYPEARAALDAGLIDASRALLVARIPGEKLQKKALAIVSETLWNGEPRSYRVAFQELREKLTQDLSIAPFKLDDDSFFEMVKVPGKRHEEECRAISACTACPHNSANDAEVKALLKGPADVCMNGECYAIKVRVHAGRVRAQAEAAGAQVLAGEAAKKIAPRKNKLVGFVDLDEACDHDHYPEQDPEPMAGEDEDSPAFRKRCDEYEQRYNEWQGRTYRQLLGEHKLKVTLIEDPKTKVVRELVPLKEVRELLKKKHKIMIPTWIGKPEPAQASRESHEEQRKRWQLESQRRQERHAAEMAWRSAVLKEIAERAAGPLKRDEIVDIADSLIESDRYSLKEGLKAIYPKLPEPAHLKDADLGKFIRLALVAEEVARPGGNNPRGLLALAKRFKVDVEKIKKAIAAEARDKKKPEFEAKAPAKKKAAAKK